MQPARRSPRPFGGTHYRAPWFEAHRADAAISGIHRQWAAERDHLANVAPGYTWNGNRFVPTDYQTSFSAAAGLTASARDYAAFSMAMDRDAFLTPATKARAYTAVVGPSGETFP